MTRLGDTNVEQVADGVSNSTIIRAADLVGIPMTIWNWKNVNTKFGPSMFVDFSYSGDDEVTVYTVVFSTKSPAYRQLSSIDHNALDANGLEVEIAESGKSFKLVDPTEEGEQAAPPQDVQDVESVSHTTPPTPPVAPASNRFAPTRRNP